MLIKEVSVRALISPRKKRAENAPRSHDHARSCDFSTSLNFDPLLARDSTPIAST
jgi:hypothetical protein